MCTGLNSHRLIRHVTETKKNGRKGRVRKASFARYTFSYIHVVFFYHPELKKNHSKFMAKWWTKPYIHTTYYNNGLRDLFKRFNGQKWFYLLNILKKNTHYFRDKSRRYCGVFCIIIQYDVILNSFRPESVTWKFKMYFALIGYLRPVVYFIRTITRPYRPFLTELSYT